MTDWTPGPWAWFGTNHGVYLATTHSGRRFVMDFVRMGTQGAQPRFQIDGRMLKAGDLVEFEVGDKSVRGFAEGRANGSTYRYDITAIDHPDARLIASAPDLYAALKSICWRLEYGHVDGAKDVARTDGVAALAKARGEPE